MTTKKETTLVLMTELDMSNIVFSDGQLRLTPYEGHASQGIALHVVSNKEITDKKKLKINEYYYISNHYREWYVGKYNGSSFDFIDSRGNFSPGTVRNCFKVIASTAKEIPSNNIIPKHSIKRFVESFNRMYNKDNPFPLGISRFDGIDLTYLTYK